MLALWVVAYTAEGWLAVPAGDRVVWGRSGEWGDSSGNLGVSEPKRPGMLEAVQPPHSLTNRGAPIGKPGSRFSVTFMAGSTLSLNPERRLNKAGGPSAFDKPEVVHIRSGSRCCDWSVLENGW